jgi:hypothetical protein
MPPNLGVQPTRYTRRVQWCLAVVSPSVVYRAWPAIARG